MDQHPVPRQITTFEFRLIGFMTLRQFIYLLAFAPIGILLFLFFPIPVVKQLIGLACVGMGIALAFLPINDRPLDVWIKNLARRLLTATQFTYYKENAPVYFFNSLVFLADPHQVFAHVESEERLKQYLAQQAAQKKQADQNTTKRKQAVNQALQTPVNPQAPQSQQPLPGSPTQSVQTSSSPASQMMGLPKKPALVGVIKNNKKIPLPGILIYIKDQSGKSIRLLKTNPHGIFATYNALSPGEYLFEIKDPKGGFVFDTMKYKIDQASIKSPLEFYSKELL